MRKSLLTVLLCLCLSLTACSAVPAPPENAAALLTRFDWSGENGESISFSDGSFELRTDELTLSGDYSANADNITLISDQSGVIIIPYNIIDDSLVLCYCGMELFFAKQKKDI